MRVLIGAVLLNAVGVVGLGKAPVNPSEVMKEGIKVETTMTHAHVSDFSDECGGEVASVNDCWADEEEGVYYRYGCVAGSDSSKVFSDACTSSSCDPASCTNEWFWEGEEADVCYDDGATQYSYACGAKPEEKVIEETPVDPIPPKACCYGNTAECLACSSGYDSATAYCNAPGGGVPPAAPDCSEYYNCMTREVFNLKKQAFCSAQLAATVIEEKATPPKACCMAFSATCLACSEGYDDATSYCNAPGSSPAANDCSEYYNCMTREVFNAKKQAYCSAQAAVEDKAAPPRACCMAMTAECLACSAGFTVEEYCNFPGASPAAVDCNEYFNCRTREVFNAAKQAFCFDEEGSFAGDVAEVDASEGDECSPMMCMMFCENGFAKDENGCDTCACAVPAPACSPIMCMMYCENGFVQDENGCDTCACAVVEEPKAEVEEEVKVSAMSCDELGWTVGDSGVCTESKINKECAGPVPFSRAQAFCEDAGARLCTSAELEADVAEGSGCKADEAAVWSSTECAEGVIVTAGASKYAGDIPTACSALTITATPRCCADAVASSSESSAVSTESTESTAPLPLGYTTATISMYPLSDQICGRSEATISGSCMLSFAGDYRNYACLGGRLSAQTCDGGCDGCSGDFVSLMEAPGRCYKGAEWLYSFTCN